MSGGRKPGVATAAQLAAAEAEVAMFGIPVEVLHGRCCVAGVSMVRRLYCRALAAQGVGYCAIARLLRRHPSSIAQLCEASGVLCPVFYDKRPLYVRALAARGSLGRLSHAAE